ncbi:MAG: DNA-binding domain-containing protein [Treponemataceae bacterium]
MIKYALRENHLVNAPNDQKSYVAQVVDQIIYDNDQIAQLMVERGSTVTKADILAVLQLYEETIFSLIPKGVSIDTNIFNSSYSISGKFESIDDVFDAHRHQKHYNLHPKKTLVELLSKLETHKVKKTGTEPHIEQVIDSKTQKTDSLITRGDTIRIKGSKLKFDASDPQQGVFLLVQDGILTRINRIDENTQSNILAHIPEDFAQGEYLLQIRTMLNTSGKASKTAKMGQFHLPLTVI